MKLPLVRALKTSPFCLGLSQQRNDDMSDPTLEMASSDLRHNRGASVPDMGSVCMFDVTASRGSVGSTGRTAVNGASP